jgi:hypothetical protein
MYNIYLDKFFHGVNLSKLIRIPTMDIQRTERYINSVKISFEHILFKTYGPLNTHVPMAASE